MHVFNLGLPYCVLQRKLCRSEQVLKYALRSAMIKEVEILLPVWSQKA